jgi:hypothetical protein
MEAQRDQILQTRTGDQQATMKMSELRKQLNQALDENIVSLM